MSHRLVRIPSITAVLGLSACSAGSEEAAAVEQASTTYPASFGVQCTEDGAPVGFDLSLIAQLLGQR
jgi:hypothetical protein